MAWDGFMNGLVTHMGALGAAMYCAKTGGIWATKDLDIVDFKNIDSAKSTASQVVNGKKLMFVLASEDVNLYKSGKLTLCTFPSCLRGGGVARFALFMDSDKKAGTIVAEVEEYVKLQNADKAV